VRKAVDPNAPRLVAIGHVPQAAEFLYKLLAERPAEANISHREMPSWEDHLSFTQRYPYRLWYIVRHGDESVGAIYLTHKYEIGLAIAKEHQGCGYGTWAVRELVRKCSKHVLEKPSLVRKAFLANIAPANEASRAFFRELGFVHIQDTYALDLE
jgi:RimJ/RimL family protein N-acetyltransferase